MGGVPVDRPPPSLLAGNDNRGRDGGTPSLAGTTNQARWLRCCVASTVRLAALVQQLGVANKGLDTALGEDCAPAVP